MGESVPRHAGEPQRETKKTEIMQGRWKQDPSLEVAGEKLNQKNLYTWEMHLVQSERDLKN